MIFKDLLSGTLLSNDISFIQKFSFFMDYSSSIPELPMNEEQHRHLHKVLVVVF